MEIKPNLNVSKKEWYKAAKKWYSDKYHNGFDLSIYDLMDLLAVSKSFIYTNIVPFVDYINTHSNTIAQSFHGIGNPEWIYFNREQFVQWMAQNFVATQATKIVDRCGGITPKDIMLLQRGVLTPEDFLEQLASAGYEIIGSPDFAECRPNERRRTQKFAVNVPFNPEWFFRQGITNEDMKLKFTVWHPKFFRTAEIAYRKAYKNGDIKLTYVADGKAVAKKTIFIHDERLGSNDNDKILLYPKQYLQKIGE